MARGCLAAREKAIGGSTPFSSSALPCLQGGAALQPAALRWWVVPSAEPPSTRASALPNSPASLGLEV